MNQELGPLLVEIYLEGAHILGMCRQVQERRRLVDVLNHQDELVEVEQANVTLAGETAARHYETLSINKTAILAAVPRETRDQNHRRAVLTNMMGRQATRQAAMALIVPPLTLEGTGHVSAGAGAMQSLHAFPKFFPLTGATLSAPGQPDRELDVVLVSRDRILALSLLPANRLARAV